jgi:integrase
MAVRKKGGQYQADFMVDGQRHRRSFATQAEAEAWELTARAALKRGQVIPDGERRSVGGGDVATMAGVLRSAAALHWSRLGNSSRASSNANLFVQWVGPNVHPSDAFSPAKLREFSKYLIEERRVSNSTLNRYSSALSVLAKHADLKAKPVLPWYKETATRVRFFSVAEEQAVIAVLDQWGRAKERDFFMFLIDTGLRTWTEAQRLPWSQVHAGSVSVLGKGRWRDVGLTERAKLVLARQNRHERGPFTSLNWSTCEALWNRVRSHIPELAGTVWYTCRHTFASRLVQQNVHLKVVADLMGNSTEMVDKRYAHLAPSHLNDAIKRLEQFGQGLAVVEGGKP